MMMTETTHWYFPARTPQDYIREMRYFLNMNPGAWCQGVSGRTGSGGPCSPNSPHARAWCMLGLVERFVHDLNVRECVVDLLLRAITPDGWMPVHVYNDATGRTVTDMIELLTKAEQIREGGAVSQEEYKKRTIEHAKKADLQETVYAYKPPQWDKLSSLNEAAVAELEKELKHSLSKLTPWPTIADRIAQAA
jgi:hypothetical protein